MKRSGDEHLSNVVAALGLALSDGIRAGTEAAAGHSAAAPSALVALDQFLGGGSMDQLRRVIGLSPSGAVRLVDRLVADGYVHRQPGADARSVALVLTPLGRSAATRVQQARSEAVAQLLACLSEEERGCLAEIADKLLSEITEQRLKDRQRGKGPAAGWLCRLCDFVACGRGDGACPAASTAQAHHT